MNNKSSLRPLYFRISIYVILFLITFSFYFFILRFYDKKITNQVEVIFEMKKEINKNREISLENSYVNNLIKLIQKITGKELQTVLYQFDRKINRDFESVKNLVLAKVSIENWKIINSNFNAQNETLNFILQLSREDIDKFFNFILDEALILKIENLKIVKIDKNLYNLEIFIKLK